MKEQPSKSERKRLLIEMMKEDEKNGMYELSDNSIPRRSRLDLNKCAELLIHQAMQEVEQMEADVRLTAAIIKLQEAKDLVSDFIDGVPFTRKDSENDRLKQIIELKNGIIDLLKSQVEDYKKIADLRATTSD